MRDNGWMTAHQAVLWIAFGNDATAAAPLDGDAWWKRWGTPPPKLADRYGMAWGLDRWNDGDKFEPASELESRIDNLLHREARPAAEYLSDLKAAMEAYDTARRAVIDAEGALQAAAARAEIEIWGHPSDPKSLAEMAALPDSHMDPIRASLFAEDGGGFRWMGLCG
jgi:hypothetical protein